VPKVQISDTNDNFGGDSIILVIISKQSVNLLYSLSMNPDSFLSPFLVN